MVRHVDVQVHSKLTQKLQVTAMTVAAVIAALLLVAGCKKEAPVETTPPPKDPRTYAWSVDTIEYPGSFQTLMYDIWGATPTDVFAVGYNDIGGAGVMYHFNGTTWNHVPLNTQLGGQIAGAFVLNAIHGLAANNIWAVGERIYINRTPPPNFLDSSLIIRFDGNAWREAPLSTRRKALLRIGGNTTTSLWVGGVLGTLYSHRGESWSSMPLDSAYSVISLAATSSTSVFSIQERGDVVQPYDSIAYRFVEHNGMTWRVLDSFLVTVHTPIYNFGFDLWVSPNQAIYSAGYGVYRWDGNQWMRALHNPSPLYKVRGTGEENIFAVGDHSVLHWNGTDWQRIDVPTGFIYRSVQMFRDEAFIIGHDGRRTIVLHGK